MDYDIKLATLVSKKSELEELKTNAENIYNELNSCYLSQISDPELSPIKNQLKEPVERLKKGATNSNTWYNNYQTELEALEASLASFSGAVPNNIVEFKGEFVDMFGKRTMSVLKTGGDIHINAPKSSIQPVFLHKEQPLPPHLKQLTSTSTLGSVKGK